MNPLVLLGLGAVAIMAAGKKKSEESERKYSGKPATLKAAKISFIDPVKPKLAKVKAPKRSYIMTISAEGPGIAKHCHKIQGLNSIEDVARCVAGDLFPVSGWPATSASEAWEHDAWHRITNVARAEFGLPPEQPPAPKPKPAKAVAFKIG